MNIEQGTLSVKSEAYGLEQKFARKILSSEEVAAVVGSRPRKEQVIMCHGTFDNVHAGHFRQLIYAKGKASILVVSLTCDEHIAKGDLRPWVPENLRAIQLAAYEIVDYVIIDQNPTPIENILKLQPDFFVKGYEYARNGINPKTQLEIETLKTYGGEMLFSPDDVIYSSTEILSREKPNLSIERLRRLMVEKGITFGRLRETADRIKEAKITVIGDVIIDKYVHCASSITQSQKEDVPSFRYAREEIFVGGAGIVAKHLRALGADVKLVTVVGKDTEAEFAINDLNKAGVEVEPIFDRTRPTTVKTRYLSTKGGRLLFKLNVEEDRTISDDILQQVCRTLADISDDAVICSDFRHGIFNKRTIPSIVGAIPSSCLRVADSQVSTRWGDITQFKGFDLITPNEAEARWSLGDQDTPLKPLAQELYIKAGCRYLMLKLGENGLMTYISPGPEHRDLFYLESFAEHVRDQVGAGDALLAAATATLVVSGNIFEASIIGSLAGGIECSKFGNVPITLQELKGGINRLELKSSAELKNGKN